MKRFFFAFALLVLSALSFAAPKRLTSYSDLVKALDSGRAVRLVAHYKKTKLIIDGKEEAAPDAVGGKTVDSWERFERGVIRNKLAYIAFSETVLIGHPRYGHVYNYVRTRVFEDGTVEMTARYLKTGTFEVVMDETFKGAINNGKNNEGIDLFSE
jgi:hypothetical protein